jgi:hypothetical protein
VFIGKSEAWQLPAFSADVKKTWNYLYSPVRLHGIIIIYAQEQGFVCEYTFGMSIYDISPITMATRFKA